MLRILVLLAALAPYSFAGAQSRDDALELLQRMYNATRKLNYTGTFIYQNGQSSESSRIAHFVDANGVQERVEVLDGAPREIVRVNDEVKCYLPHSGTVKVERLMADRPLLPVLPTRITGLSEHYNVRKGPIERVAGMDSQVVELEPKDNLRYGHRLWGELGSKMVLRAQALDQSREVVEGFTFTEIKIGGAIPRELLRARFASKSRDWRVEESGAVATNIAQHGWTLRQTPPGFQKLAEVKRRFGTAADVSQVVLTDGIAAVSIFIERAAGRVAEVAPLGASRQGSINVFTRVLGEHLVTVVGDVPAECVQSIATGIDYQPK